MSKRQTLSGGGAGGPRRLVAPILGALFVVVFVWIGAVLVLGSGETTGSSARQPAQPESAPNNEDRAATERTATPLEEGIPLEEGTPVEGGPLAREGEGARQDGGLQQRADEQEEGGGEPRSEGPDLPEGGSQSEPGRYDPLGTGAAPGDLSPTERGRARQAAAYVLYAFGYTGGNHAEYLSAVNLTVLSPEFYGSPGAEGVGAFAQAVADGGTESTATLTDFELKEESLTEVRALATFSVDGSVTDGRFTQRLELVKWGAGWKVRAAGEVGEADE